ncbi:uncharacterized protein LOC129911159 [Episyrphus balteatus]|uniref:uncharacterized protein LOC129911159 n=1 Tax=Episyrphus balteatus TaxID=286459 RepID=UPI00248686F1|nr:uncharacterized protein LOC129911159 [Episyrphus balteatus]
MLVKQKARYILDLNAEERKEFLKSFDIVLSDCDGVIWLLAGPIPGAGNIINLFLQAGKKYKLISNNSMRSDDEYLDLLGKMGVQDIGNNDIVHPVKTITRYLQKHKPGQLVYSMGCDVFNDHLRKSGIEVQTLESRNDWTFSLLSKSLKPVEPVGAVIFDLSLNLSYAALVHAQQHLKNNPNTDFIVGATDENAPVTKDLVVIGPSGFIQLLKENTGKDPIVLGKPGPLLGKFLKEHFEIKDPKRAIFFGDALEQDIKFGNACGFQTLLMLSGATTKEQMLALPEEHKPDYYANNIEDLKQLFEQKM